MAAFPEKTLVILGPTGAGKATITGCMLFKYGGIDMDTMQLLEGLGVHDKIRGVYGQSVDNLKSLKKALQFYTPKRNHVTVRDPGTGLADCAILVLPADSFVSEEAFGHLLGGAAKELIIVINKMDAVNWSEEYFQKVVETLDLDTENVPVIPISALNNDNVLEKSPNGSWYKGWKRGGQSGVTLLEALDVSFQN